MRYTVKNGSFSGFIGSLRSYKTTVEIDFNSKLKAGFRLVKESKL